MSGWMALTFFGGVLNFSILGWMSTMLPELQTLGQNMYWIGLASLVLAAIFIPVIYSGIASHILPQKTLIRPLDMSVVTAGLLLYQEKPLLTSDASKSALILLLLAGIIALGMVSEAGAVSLVGYGRRPAHQRTLKVEVPIQRLQSKLSEESVKRAFHLDKHKSLYNDKLVIFRNDDSEYAFFVVLVESGPTTTYVHMEGYDIARLVIEGTPESKMAFDHDTDGIKVLIEKQWSKNANDTQDYELRFPFKSTIEAITHEPSIAKFSVLGRLPKTTIFVLVGAAFLASAAYLLYLNSGVTGIGIEFFASTLIGLGVLVLGLLPFMKWSRKEKGWEN